MTPMASPRGNRLPNRPCRSSRSISGRQRHGDDGCHEERGDEVAQGVEQPQAEQGQAEPGQDGEERDDFFLFKHGDGGHDCSSDGRRELYPDTSGRPMKVRGGPSPGSSSSTSM